MAMFSLEPYRAALRRDVCGPCPDRHPHGGCARPTDDPCSIETNLGPTVEAILEVGNSPLIDDYVTALRAKVCPDCRQDPDGRCDWRDRNGCKLDAFILQIVEVVETTRDELAARNENAA